MGYNLGIAATGVTFNSDFLQKNLAQCVAPNGQIYVNDFFQLTTVDPRINPTSPALRANIFAFGDVCITSLGPAMGLTVMKQLGGYV